MVPAVSPLTIPDDDPIVATAGLLLLHQPPDVASVSVVLVPVQIFVMPDIDAGGVTTSTVCVARQAPELYEYDMVTIPVPTPVTTPDVPTVALDVLLLLQVPPVVESPRDVVDPTHTVSTPRIGLIVFDCM